MPRLVTTIITHDTFYQQIFDWDANEQSTAAIRPASEVAETFEQDPTEETHPIDPSIVAIPTWPAQPLLILYPTQPPIYSFSHPTSPPLTGWASSPTEPEFDTVGTITSAGSDAVTLGEEDASTPSDGGNFETEWPHAEPDNNDDDSYREGEWRIDAEGNWMWVALDGDMEAEVHTEWGWGSWESQYVEPAQEAGPVYDWRPWWR